MNDIEEDDNESLKDDLMPKRTIRKWTPEEVSDLFSRLNLHFANFIF